MLKGNSNISIQNLALALVLIIVPLIFSFSLNDPWNMPRFVGLAGCLSLVGIWSIFKKHSDLRLGMPFLALAGSWLAIMTLASFNSPDASEALYLVGMRFMLIGLMVWLSAHNLKEQIPIFLSIFGCIEVLIGIGQLIGIVEFDAQAEGVVGTVGNPNGFGSLMVLLLPISILNWNHKAKNIQILGKVSAGLILIGILISTSIAAYLALGIMIGLVVIWKFLGQKLRSSSRIAHWMATGLLFLLILAPIVWGLGKYDKDVPMGKEITSISERSYLWGETVKMISDQPLTGTGIAGWKYSILKQGFLPPSTDFGGRFYAEPHNDFLGMFAEGGLLAGIAYLGLCLFLFGLGVRQALTFPGKESQWKATLLAAGIAAWCIISSFHFPIERIDHLVVIAALGGLILVNQKPIGKQGITKGIFAAVAVGSLFLLYFGWMRMSNEQHLKKLVEAKSRSNWPSVLKESKMANSQFCHADYYSSTPIAWYEGLAHYQLGNTKEALQSFQEAHLYNSFHPHVLNNLAGTFVAENELDSALVYYEKARKTFPAFVDPYINSAKIKTALGYKEEAIAILNSFPKSQKEGRKIILVALGELE